MLGLRHAAPDVSSVAGWNAIKTRRNNPDARGSTSRQPEVFWQLDIFPTRAAADVAKTPSGTVVEALGKTWLLTIGDAGWKPTGGERVAEIGPLPIRAGDSYSAQYMEAIFSPGMTAPSHTHPGEPPQAPPAQVRDLCSAPPDPIDRASAIHVLAAFQGGLWVIIAARSVACAPGPQPALRFDRGHLLNPAPTVAAEGARPGRPLWISAEPRIPPRPLRAQQRADGACAARKLHSPSRRPSIA